MLPRDPDRWIQLPPEFELLPKARQRSALVSRRGGGAAGPPESCRAGGWDQTKRQRQRRRQVRRSATHAPEHRSPNTPPCPPTPRRGHRVSRQTLSPAHRYHCSHRLVAFPPSITGPSTHTTWAAQTASNAHPRVERQRGAAERPPGVSPTKVSVGRRPDRHMGWAGGIIPPKELPRAQPASFSPHMRQR
jgi:hypothetical protein